MQEQKTPLKRVLFHRTRGLFGRRVFVVFAVLVFLVPLLTAVYSITRAGSGAGTRVEAAVGINRQISFQGKLVNPNGTNVTDGSYSIVFSIYSVASAGTAIWTETQSATLSNGIFQVNLGSVTALPGSVDFNTDNIYLGIKVGADAEMTPRIQFTAVPQAFNSEKLGGLDKTGYIQNSTSQQASSNFNVSGSGVVGTSLTTPILQAAGALTVQTQATAGADDIIFNTAGTEKFRILENGNVQRTAAGTWTYDLVDAANTTFAITNSGAGVANLTVDGATTIGGALAVTGASTFTGLATFNGGITVETGDNFIINGDTLTDLTGSGLTNTAGALTVDATSATGFFRNGGNSFGATAVLGTNDANDLAFETGGTTKLTVQNSTGNVGIGTTAPAALLNLKGTLSSALTGTVAVTNLSTTVTGTGTLFTTELAVGDSIKIGTEVFTVSTIGSATSLTLDTAYQGTTASGLTAYRDPNLFAIDNGDGVNKLTVTRSGNVGIGTSTPGDKLQIVVNTANAGLTVNGTTKTMGMAVNLGGGSYNGITQSNDVGIIYSGGAIDTAGGFVIAPWKSSTAGIRLDGNGLVGIGMSPSSTGSLLQISGAVQPVLSAAPAATAALNGSIVYDSTAGKFKVYEGGVVKVLCNTTDMACGSAGSGVTTIGALDGGTANANGAFISGVNLYLQSASATNAGLVNTGAQTLAGAKSFNSLLTVTASGSTIRALSGSATLNASIEIGATAIGGSLASVGPVSNYAGDALQGDIVLRTEAATQRLLLGNAGNRSALSVYNNTVGVGTPYASNMFSVSPLQYNTGTAGTGGVASTTVTGVGTTFTAAMVGSEIFFANNQKSTITAVASATSLTVAASINVPAGSNYAIQYVGLQVNAAGNVGIGTSAPNAKLHVEQGLAAAPVDLRIENTSTAASANGARLLVMANGTNNTGNAYARFITKNGGVGEANYSLGVRGSDGVFQIANSTDVQGTSGIFLNSAGNVGIGTATPGGKLSVAVSSAGTGIAAVQNILLTNSSFTNNNTNGIVAQNSAGGNVAGIDFVNLNQVADSAASGAINLWTNTSGTKANALTVAYGGNVGIGMAPGSTGALVQVAGMIQPVLSSAPAATAALNGSIVYDSTAGKFKVYEGGVVKVLCNTTDMACGSAGSGVTTIGALDGGTANANGAFISGVNLYLQSASATNAGLVNTGTQTFAGSKTFDAVVGIGVTTTSSKLEVDTDPGENRIALKVDQGDTTNNNRALVVLNSGTGDTLFVGDDGTSTDTTPFVIDASGNVGVGLSAPTYKLDVVGDINNTTGYRIGGTLIVRPIANSSFFVGQNVGNATVTGTFNLGFGLNALQGVTSGSDNTAIGQDALTTAGMSGNGNVAVGGAALQSNTTGSGNTAIGRLAAQSNTTGSDNTSLGGYALNSNVTGIKNTAIGEKTLRYSTGASNTSVGADSLSAVGMTGANNTALGRWAGDTTTTGAGNTFLGYAAGASDPDSGTFVSLSNLSRSTGIGYGATVQANNSLILGGQGVNQVKVGIGTSIPTNTLSVSPVQSFTGTAGTGGVASTTVTGVGTSFTSAMIGSEIIFANGTAATTPVKTTISAVASVTSLTVSNSITVAAGTSFRINHIGLQVTDAGNVGIGTATPGFKLDVLGTAALRTNGQLRFYTSDNSDYARIESVGVASDNSLSFSTDVISALYIAANGNVGIGTTAPGATLSVGASGVGKTYEQYVDGAAGTTVWTVKRASDGAAFGQYIPTSTSAGGWRFSTQASETIVMGGGGGSQFTLNGSGNLKLSSYTNTNGIFYGDASGNVLQTATGGVGTLCLTSASGAAPVWGACSGSASTAWSSLTNPVANLSLSMGTFTTTFTGAATTASSLFTFTGNSTAGSGITPAIVSNGVQSVANTGSFVGIQSNPSYTAAGTLDTLKGLRLTPFNNGTGTVTNMYGLTSELLNQSTGTVTNAYGWYVQGQNASTGTISNLYGGYVAAPSNSGTITNKYALVTEAGAGNVGIGTTTPSTPLTVKSGTHGQLLLESIGSFRAQVTLNSGNSGDQSVIYLDDAGTNKFQIGKQGDQSFFMYDAVNGRDFLRETTTGQLLLQPASGSTSVGSVTTGVAKLYVDTDPGENLVGLEVWQEDTTNNNIAVRINNAGSGSSFRVNDDGTDTDSTPFVIDSGGNVGIGVTNPSGILEIGGTNSNATGLNIDPTLTNTTSNQLAISLQPTLTPSNGFQAIAQYVSPNINVGAGITTPNGIGISIDTPTKIGTGTITTYQSLYVSDPGTTATDNYAIYVSAGKSYFGGNVGIGDTTPAALFTVGSGDLFQVNTNGSQTIAQAAVAGGQNALIITSGAHTAVTAEKSSLQVAASTLTITSGLATQRFNRFDQQTITAASALTVTDAATVAIAGAPIKAGSAVLTNTSALLIQAGAVSTATNSYALNVNAQTGATNNYAAIFQGGNVGVGIAAPTALLHVSGAGGGLGLFKVTDTTSAAQDVLGVADGGAVTLRNQTDSTAALLIQNASSTTVFTVDTTNAQVIVGNSGNTLTFNPTTGLTAAGTARKAKRLLLTSEYAGAVLDAGSGANNSGTMTSGVNVTSRMNYYKWTTTQVTNQNFDVVIQVPIPADFDGFSATNPIRISTYTTDTTNGTVTFELRDSTNAVIQNFVSVTPTAASAWQTKDPGTVTGTYTGGDYLTIRIRMQSPLSGDTRIGNLYLDYLSKF